MKILKNKLKIIFSSLVVILAAIFIHSCAKDGGSVIEKTDSLLVQNRLKQCDDDDLCSTILLPKYFKKKIFIQGCEVEVEYWVSECYSTAKQANIVKFYDMKFKVKNSIACNTLLPTLMVGQEIQYNNLVNAAYKKVLDKIEADYMNSIYPSGTKYSVEYIESNCFMYCYKVISDEEGNSWIDINSVKCGESCCKRSTKYTRAPGNVWVKEPTIVIGDPICRLLAVPETCTGKGTSLGVCNVACARL